MLSVIPRLVAEGVVCDAVVTDPPYGLEFMGKEWDTFGAKLLTSTEHADHMNRSASHGPWGRGDRPIAPNSHGQRNEKCLKCGRWRISSNRCQCAEPEFASRSRREAPPAMRAFQEFSEEWARLAFDILKPGGFMLAFGGTRTHHRMVCAIEDAGFVIQDTIAWLYGSGFPKNKAMLKPAFEPICLAYKPGGKRTLQVDECRVSLGDGEAPFEYPNGPGGCKSSEFHFHNRAITPAKGSALGRWPANVAHDSSAEVIEAFAAFGDKPTGAGGITKRNTNSPVYTGPASSQDRETIGYADNGTAARFFFSTREGEESAERRYAEIGSTNFSARPGERREPVAPSRLFYHPKADKQDRWGSRHPTVKPVELMKWLVPLVTPPGGLVLDPFAGSGTTGVAALATGRDCILIEREAAYIEDIRQRLAFYEGGGAHSVQAKNRSRQTEAGPLFAETR